MISGARAFILPVLCGFILTACHVSRLVAVEKGDAGLAEKNGILFYQGAAFSGTVEEWYAAGRPESREEYSHGKRHGSSLRYYPSGALQWKRTFVHGEKEGLHEGWWENGRRKFAYPFHKGVYQGDVKEWYADGSPALLMHYKQGAEAGLQRAWRENGVLYVNYEVRDGRRYGMVNVRLCYSVRDGKGVFHEAQEP